MVRYESYKVTDVINFMKQVNNIILKYISMTTLINLDLFKTRSSKPHWDNRLL